MRGKDLLLPKHGLLRQSALVVPTRARNRAPDQKLVLPTPLLLLLLLLLPLLLLPLLLLRLLMLLPFQQPLSCRYLKHPKHPRSAAAVHTLASHGHSFSYRYLRHSKCPWDAAIVKARLLQGHPLSCAYLRHSNCPFFAA